MPIRVGCPSCRTSLKLADALAGKAVKCPKCSTILRVPGSSGLAPSPAVKAAPPPERRIGPDSDTAEELEEVEEEPVDELEEIEGDKDPGRRGSIKHVTGRNWSMEHDVPEQLRDRIAEELSGDERLVWIGQPVKALMMIRSLKGTGFGLFILALFGFIWFAVAFPTLFGHKKEGDTTVLMVLMGGIFFGVLVGVIFWPFWYMYRAGRTCYALTNRRAVVWACEWNGQIKITSYAPADLTRMQRADSWIYGRGAGDLIFRSQTVVTASTRGVSSRTYHFGFLAIDNVRAIEKLVRETLVDRFLDRLNR